MLTAKHPSAARLMVQSCKPTAVPAAVQRLASSIEKRPTSSQDPPSSRRFSNRSLVSTSTPFTLCGA
jgi:hypothetical protein